MNNKLIFILGALIIFFSTFSSSLTDTINPSIDIGINEPSAEIIEEVSEVSDIVLSKDDKISLAIFNKVFADRLVSYETTQQQLNDVYVLAAKNYFDDSLKDKYDDLDNFIIRILRSVTGDQVHVLSDEEKSDLQKKFYGISWCLVN
tara:strand:+ start:339 stop:779 length:441 start_codon:yes stop_codon:yes gene_type:complete